MEGESASFEEIMNRIGKGLDTHTVFGEPEQVDGSAIIPVAKIRYGGGGGFGGEGKPMPGATAEQAAAGAGEGMGMGFGISAEPLGVVRVMHDSIEWVPIVDRSRILVIWSVVSGLALLILVRRMFAGR
jgi:uncharacterized spore protein YtfJ